MKYVLITLFTLILLLGCNVDDEGNLIDDSGNGVNVENADDSSNNN